MSFDTANQAVLNYCYDTLGCAADNSGNILHLLSKGCKATGLFCYLLNMVAQLQSFWVCVKCIFDYENIQKKEESAEVENTKN